MARGLLMVVMEEAIFHKTIMVMQGIAPEGEVEEQDQILMEHKEVEVLVLQGK